MQRIRAEKEFVLRWSGILTNGEPESLEGRDLTLYLINPYGVESSLAITVENNTITARISAGTCNVLGQYRLKLYENKGKSGQTVLDHCEGFVVVPTTCQEGDNTPGLDIDSVELSGGDMALGVKGDKGDPLRYEDLTDEQKAELQRPALEAVEPLRTSMQTGLNLLLGSDTTLLDSIRTYQISSANIAGRQADGWWRVKMASGTTDGEIYIEQNIALPAGKYAFSCEIKSDADLSANVRFHAVGYDYSLTSERLDTIGDHHYRAVGTFVHDGEREIRKFNIYHINAPDATYIDIRFPILSASDDYIPWQPSLYDLTRMRQELQEATLGVVNNIDIGGVNLIPDSLNYLNELKVYPHDDSKYSYVMSGNYRRINLLQGNLNNAQIVQEKFLSDIDKLRDLTYSVIVRTDGRITGGYFRVRGQASSPTEYMDLDTKIKKVSDENKKWWVYATLKKDSPYLFSKPIVLQLQGVTTEGATYIEFGYPKVEYGNQPTDWSPAIGEQQGSSLDDAPSDGNTYGRKNGAWTRTVGRIDPNSDGTGEVFNDYTKNVASGTYSHAEGRSATASGFCSHAEGNYTTASSFYAHAEGSSTIARGETSHAEGYQTIAEGMYSHTEGYQTIAKDRYSHAEGLVTIASNICSHAEGLYNICNSGNTGADMSLHMVGIGTSVTDRKNAHEIMRNGDHYIYGIGGYDGKNYSEAKTLQKVIAELSTQVQTLQNTINELKGEQA